MGKYILLTDFKIACVSGQIQMLNITGWKTKALNRRGRGLNWFVVAEKNNLEYKIFHKLCSIISFITYFKGHPTYNMYLQTSLGV